MSHKPLDIRFNSAKEKLLIGVISDTHLVRTSGVPAKVKEIFRDVDRLLSQSGSDSSGAHPPERRTIGAKTAIITGDHKISQEIEKILDEN